MDFVNNVFVRLSDMIKAYEKNNVNSISVSGIYCVVRGKKMPV